MDPLFQAMSLFRRRQFEQSVEVATRLLEKNPNDQVRSVIMHFHKFSLTYRCKF
jgi:hypothetical protein